MFIDVCFSPTEIQKHTLHNCIAVVTDVLRATTTICAALSKGFKDIRVYESVEEAMRGKASVQEAHLQVLAGEVHCIKPEGFDVGNSPTEVLRYDSSHAPHLHLATTNGTKMIMLSSAAAYQFIGALVNVDATVAHIQQLSITDMSLEGILLCCAGTNGGFSLEDSLFAGAFIRRYIAHSDSILLTDAARAAVCIADAYENNISRFITHAHHAQRLIQLGFREDVDLCLRLNALPLVAEVRQGIIRVCDLMNY